MYKSWSDFFKAVEKKEYFQSIEAQLQAEYEKQNIYPSNENRYAAFTLTPYDSIRVVILGQDPYHQPNQAHGLAFSVVEGTPLPPSLRNIYKEIESDLGVVMNYRDGNLKHWASQGVFLLNTTLTVAEGKPLSHRLLPYPLFIKDVFHALNSHPHELIFLLWGRHAQSYARLIDSRHHILMANHPSPLSANQGGWFGSRHFSKTNAWLMTNGFSPIHWANQILG